MLSHLLESTFADLHESMLFESNIPHRHISLANFSLNITSIQNAQISSSCVQTVVFLSHAPKERHQRPTVEEEEVGT